MINILIVEDERPISNLIRVNLAEGGYSCDVADDGMQAADMIEQNRYDLILLDIMLPKVNGYELMEYIAPTGTPVMLTAKVEDMDKITGLSIGADDYIIKPFEIVELLARVEAVLRRYNKGESRIAVGDVEIDTQSRCVKKNGRQIDLTMKEYELLLLFIRNKNIALFRETIFERVWQSDYLGDTRTVDLHVQRLRKKLGWEKMIVAVYKVGYRLEY